MRVNSNFLTTIYDDDNKENIFHILLPRDYQNLHIFIIYFHFRPFSTVFLFTVPLIFKKIVETR